MWRSCRTGGALCITAHSLHFRSAGDTLEHATELKHGSVQCDKKPVSRGGRLSFGSSSFTLFVWRQSVTLKACPHLRLSLLRLLPGTAERVAHVQTVTNERGGYERPWDAGARARVPFTTDAVPAGVRKRSCVKY